MKNLLIFFFRKRTKGNFKFIIYIMILRFIHVIVDNDKFLKKSLAEGARVFALSDNIK